MKIEVVQANYGLLGKTFVFPADVSRIVLSGDIKAENVKMGDASINLGRAQVQFVDRYGDMVGGWPDGERIKGTTGWRHFRREFTAPDRAIAVRVMLGIYLSTGVIYARDFELSAYGKDGKPLAVLSVNEDRTDTKGWEEFKPSPEGDSRKPVFDFSQIIPAPAGKSGFVRSKKGRFVTGSGERIRFWGTNESFKLLELDKKQISARAEHYLKNGINLVRLHHMDNGWSSPLLNIFSTSSDNTLKLNESLVDKLDYFVSECKKRGIYIYIDLLVTRKFKTGDNVRDWETLNFGAKIAAHFNRRLIQLQKDFARLYLDRVNPYTGLKYTQEPAIAMLDIVNESSMFWKHGYDLLPKSYLDELQQLYAQWCRKNSHKLSSLPISELLEKNDPVTLDFLSQIQNSYFDEMSGFLKNDLGFKGMVTASNHWDGFAADTLSNARYDFVDRHSYWDHPGGGYTPQCDFTDKSAIKNLLITSTPPSFLAAQRIKGKPFVVSEWCFCWPNEYIAEGPFLMGAMASFQDWDGMLVFGLEPWKDKMEGCFDPGNKPHVRIPFWAMAIIYLRGDIKSGPEHIIKARIPAKAEGMDKNIPAGLILQKKIVTEFSPESGAGVQAAEKPVPAVIKSADGQLCWRKEGYLSINTNRTQGFCGFCNSETVRLKDIEIKIDNEFGELLVISLDNMPLAESRRMLVVAVARCENSNQVYKVFRKGLKNTGSSPIIYEPLKGRITFTSKEKSGGRATVYAVDSNFVRTTYKVVIANTKNGAPVMELSNMPFLAYELCWE